MSKWCNEDIINEYKSIGCPELTKDVILKLHQKFGFGMLYIQSLLKRFRKENTVLNPKYNYRDFNTFKEFEEAYARLLLPYVEKMEDLRSERNQLNWEYYIIDNPPENQYAKPTRSKKELNKRYEKIKNEYDKNYKIYSSIKNEYLLLVNEALSYFKDLQDKHDKKIAKLTKERLIYEFYEKYNCSYKFYKELVKKYGLDETRKILKQDYIKGIRPEV